MGDIGQNKYQSALIDYIKSRQKGIRPRRSRRRRSPPRSPWPTRPGRRWTLNTADAAQFESRPGQFFHLAPFGAAEQHPYLTGGDNVPLLPQFSFVRDSTPLQSEAEFYIGVAGLAPPQKPVAAVPGRGRHRQSAGPEAEAAYRLVAILRTTCGFRISGERRRGRDRRASDFRHRHLRRAARCDERQYAASLRLALDPRRGAAKPATRSAACRLVAAQAMEAVFFDQGNAPDFSATPLPAGTISKLATPDAAVKERQPALSRRSAGAAPKRRRTSIGASANGCATRIAPSICGTTSI